MPDRRAHRGAHPQDRQDFAPANVPALARAVAELSWLLTRRYAEKSALALVGDHYQFTARQRSAIMRCACGDGELTRRREHQAAPAELAGQPIILDGYNILTTVEAALAGGALFLARDGCLRDMASMHGSYRKVAQTLPALELLGSIFARLGTSGALWYLDAPVSNSGRLKTIIRDLAAQHGWDWRVELVPSPDHELIQAQAIVATADSIILNRCRRWFNLGRYAVAQWVGTPWVIDLSGSANAP
jgi:hypothetical protein